MKVEKNIQKSKWMRTRWSMHHHSPWICCIHELESRDASTKSLLLLRSSHWFDGMLRLDPTICIAWLPKQITTCYIPCFPFTFQLSYDSCNGTFSGEKVWDLHLPHDNRTMLKGQVINKVRKYKYISTTIRGAWWAKWRWPTPHTLTLFSLLSVQLLFPYV